MITELFFPIITLQLSDMNETCLDHEILFPETLLQIVKDI